jgi:hypothetical protein
MTTCHACTHIIQQWSIKMDNDIPWCYHTMLFYSERLVLGHVNPPWTSVNSGHNAKLLQGTVQPALCQTQPQLLQCYTVLFQYLTHQHFDDHDLLQDWDWEIRALPLYSLDHMQCFTFISSHQAALGRCRFKFTDTSKNVIMGSLCHLNMDDYRAAWDHPPNEWREGVQRTCTGLCWVEDMQGCILSYGSHWLNKFVNFWH